MAMGRAGAARPCKVRAGRLWGPSVPEGGSRASPQALSEPPGSARTAGARWERS